MRVAATILLATTVGATKAPWRLPEGELSDADFASLFDGWKARWNKTYSPEEEAHRRGVFADNMRWVISAGQTETHGMTAFADQSEEEFRKARLHPLTPEQEEAEAEARKTREKWDGTTCETCKRFPEMATYAETGATSLDWSTKGAVTRPKDQGQCNSCFAFGASGDIEGAWFMAGNKLTSVSEQMMLDCSGHGGCSEHSGTRSELFKFVIDYGGVTTESKYPYEERKESCKSAKEGKEVQIDSYLQISDSADGEDQILDAVNKLGPITIGISAVRMELYGGGIISGVCNKKHDHAPVIVGYGVSGAKNYWKIKNSWGDYWGEDGYFRIVRGSNECGLASDALHSKVGGGSRYQCDAAAKKCSPGPRGHATLQKCQATCGVPTPPPAPPTPKPPTPPPTPPITRYHCENSTAQCYEVKPGNPIGGHSTLEQCQVHCYSHGGYSCNATSKQCYAVTSGGSQLHVCQQQCGSPPTPIPMWTPAPPPPQRYHCEQNIFGSKCVAGATGHSTLAKCQAVCV